MSGMSGGCASGSTTTGATSSLASTATGGGTIAMGYGTSLAAASTGMGGGALAAITGTMGSTNAGMAAAYTGMGGYGATAWSNPSAQVTNAYGTSSGGFGAMSGLNGGPSSFGWSESYLMSDSFDAARAAAERGSTSTTPRMRVKSTRSQSKVKHRGTRVKGSSR
jgi:hypothetical protein